MAHGGDRRHLPSSDVGVARVLAGRGAAAVTRAPRVSAEQTLHVRDRAHVPP